MKGSGLRIWRVPLLCQQCSRRNSYLANALLKSSDTGATVPVNNWHMIYSHLSKVGRVIESTCLRFPVDRSTSRQELGWQVVSLQIETLRPLLELDNLQLSGQFSKAEYSLLPPFKCFLVSWANKARHHAL